MQVTRKWMLGARVLVTVLGLAACAAWPGADRTVRPTAWPLAAPVADTPAAGICSNSPGSTVTITIEPDTPAPRCAAVTPDQHLIVENRTGEARQISIALFTAHVPAGQAHSFYTPFGDYLAPGVHLVTVSGLAGGAEIWLVPAALPQEPESTQPTPSGLAAPSPPRAEANPTKPGKDPWASAGALYGVGPEPGPELHAWSREQGERGLGLIVYPGAVVSHSGRWLATPATYPEATAVQVYHLEAGTQAEYTTSSGYTLYGMAFDSAETRLGFLELAPPAAVTTPWALVVVRLDDGMVTRFEGSTLPEADRYPGNPLGWTAPGDELILRLFIPYSDGVYVGVRARANPPDAAGGFASGLVPRTILAAGEYMSTVRLSPDGTRLLYLGRDPNYTPADYEPAMQDWAVNRLWWLDLATGARTMLYEVTNGDALLNDAAWSPGGSQLLFAQGHYAGSNLGTLTLKMWDAGQVRDVAVTPMDGETWLAGVYWCHPETAFTEFRGPAPLPELLAVDLGGEAMWWQPVGGASAFMVGCVAPDGR